MTEVLLATCSYWPDGEPEGGLLVEALARRGLAAGWASWDDRSVDWSSARAVVVRSTWDYETRREEFLHWADHVCRWSHLLNGPSVFRWNTDKSYLLDLERIGVPIVPTRLLTDPTDLPDLADVGDRVVVKPRVGAGGRGLSIVETTGVLVPGVSDLGVAELGGDEERLGWIVQPLVTSVRTEGELSVFVLGGVPVSAARKLPAAGEIRVHEMYGGTTEPAPLDDEAMLLATETVAATGQLLGEELAYARVDLLRLDDGRLVVAELEATEPGLYLDVLPANAEAFADVVAAVLDEADPDAVAEPAEPLPDPASDPVT
jgi:glutathione synthase/RimK-type ligase-like ATP-grasp enzyme